MLAPLAAAHLGSAAEADLEFWLVLARHPRAEPAELLALMELIAALTFEQPRLALPAGAALASVASPLVRHASVSKLMLAQTRRWLGCLVAAAADRSEDPRAAAAAHVLCATAREAPLRAMVHAGVREQLQAGAGGAAGLAALSALAARVDAEAPPSQRASPSPVPSTPSHRASPSPAPDDDGCAGLPAPLPAPAMPNVRGAAGGTGAARGG